METLRCKECQQEYKIGGGLHRHLKLHGLTLIQYSEKYPKEVELYKTLSYSKRQKNSPMSIEFYLNKGQNIEEATDNYKKHLSLKNNKVSENKFKNDKTYDYWITLGYSKEEAAVILSKNNSRSLDFFTKKYGEETGRKKFKNMIARRSNQNKSSNAIEKLIKTKNISKDEAIAIFKEKHRNGPKNISYWLKRGYTLQESEKKRYETVINDSPRRKEYWINRYGLTLFDAMKAVANFQHRNFNNAVSKESMKVFASIRIAISDRFSMNNNDFLFGSRTDELKLFDDEHETFYYYDLYIPKFKLIIEYHGSKFHPNPTVLGNRLLEWKQLKSNKSAQEILDRDRRKQFIAEKNGFTPITIWDTDKIEDKINEIIQIGEMNVRH